MTSSGVSTSSPLPPSRGESSIAQGSEFGAGAVSWSRFLRSIGSGSFSASCMVLGISSIMLTVTIVSSSDCPRSRSKTGAALSQTTATRAAWSWKGPRSSGVV